MDCSKIQEYINTHDSFAGSNNYRCRSIKL